MTARIRCLLARCCLCLIIGGAISRDASATQWMVPQNARDQSDLVSSLLQNSEHVVLARIDSCGNADAQDVLCTALEYFKGGRFPRDRFKYFDHAGVPVATGERYLLFLTRSKWYGLALTRAPHRFRITEDDRIVVRYRQYDAAWPSYRDSIVKELAGLTPARLAAAADYAIRGTTTTPSLTKFGSRKYGSMRVRMRASYAPPTAAERDSVVFLDFPSPEFGPFKSWILPPLLPDQDVILFLDRVPSGHFTLHGGIYGMWSVSGDSARVLRPPELADGLQITLAALPVDSLIAMIKKH